MTARQNAFAQLALLARLCGCEPCEIVAEIATRKASGQDLADGCPTSLVDDAKFVVEASRSAPV